MPNEINEIHEIEAALRKDMRAVRHKRRHLMKLKSLARSEEKDLKHGDHKHLVQDIEKFNEYEYVVLLDEIQSLNAFIIAFRDENKIEHEEHHHNEYKKKIHEEVVTLREELRMLTRLDAEAD